jgi:DNA repair protein RecN (Recombination protein N)
MLTRLYVQNYALIESLEVEFQPGLNILTGETGAGKSILIDALGLALGERADSDSVRTGAKQAVVEAEFRIDSHGSLKVLFDELGLEWTGGLSVRREVSAAGKSRALVNDGQVPLAGLKRIGDALLDMHGQHQHQSLLYEDRHLDFLDGYARAWAGREAAASLFREHQRVRRELDEMRGREKLTREKLDLYAFQIREIEAARLAEGEEVELEREQAVLSNSEKLFSLASEGYRLLYENEGSISEQLGASQRALEQIAGIDGRTEEMRQGAQAAGAQLEELARELRRYRDSIQFDPARLEEVRQRLDLIRTLRKKYGGREGGVAAVLLHLSKIQSEVDSVEHGQERIDRLADELESKRRELEKACLALSEKRQAAAKKMAKEVMSQLRDLGMEKAAFQVEVLQTEQQGGLVRQGRKSYQAEAAGIDKARFLISPNAGEEPKPLARIASGGEISRVMLAVKTILAEVDQVSSLVFDEIDAGIGGRVAEAVGRKLRQIGEKRQVLCITHLPQIAALAQAHYRVSKGEQTGRTLTTVEPLSEKERVEEVARMLGGEKVTESALRHAREMVGQQ